MKRCDTCEFWVRGEQWGKQKDRHPDERTGGCHRNAPQPTLGDFEYELMKQLTIIANTTETDKEWEECRLYRCAWPQTHGSDWCGEWKVKDNKEK
jgi:hypothetical protein